jgi:hypothetical protein
MTDPSPPLIFLAGRGKVWTGVPELLKKPGIFFGGGKRGRKEEWI